MATTAQRLENVRAAIDAIVSGRPVKVSNPDGTAYELASLDQLQKLESTLAAEVAASNAGNGGAYVRVGISTFGAEGGR